MDRFGEIRARLVEMAQQDGQLLAVIAIGSTTRAHVPADEFSDLDVIIATREPEAWLYGDRPCRLGEMRISFVEPTLGGGFERRMLYEGSLDVDLLVFTPEQLLEAIRRGEAGWVMNRGYQVLHDGMGVTPLLQQAIPPQAAYSPMDEGAFVNMVNDFFFHAVWTEKKLRRGETWTAKMCLDAYLKRHLLKALEMARCTETDVWHDGRFLDQWAGADTAQELRACFAHYDREDMAKALAATVRLFARLGREAAQKHGYAWPRDAEAYARGLLGA